MADPRFSLAEAFDVLVRPEFDAWIVAKSDGSTTKFDPLTLMDSLAESEIPLLDAARIFDRVVALVADYSVGEQLSLETLHSIVIEAIIQDTDQRNSVWLANYHAVFAPSYDDLADSEQLLNVRDNQALKHFLADFLYSRFEIGPSGADDAPDQRDRRRQVEEAVSKAGLERMTRRVGRMLRYCGLLYVDKKFLATFCAEIAQMSVKGILPSTDVPQAQISDRLESAYVYLELAAKRGRSNIPEARIFLEYAGEYVAASILESHGVLSRRGGTSPGEALEQIQHSLKSGQVSRETRPTAGVQLAFSQFHDGVQYALSSTRRTVQELILLCGRYQRNVSELSRDLLAETVALGYTLLGWARLITGSDPALGAIFASASSAAADPLPFFQSLAEYFREFSVRSKTVPTQQAGVVFQLDPQYRYTQLQRFGRTVDAKVFSSSRIEVGDDVEVESFVRYIQTTGGSVGLAIFQDRPSPAILESLKVSAEQSFVVLPVDMSKFLQLLLLGEGFFEALEPVMFERYPFLRDQNIVHRPNPAPIDESFGVYERDILESSWGLLEEGRWKTGLKEAADLYEGLIRTQCQFLLGLCRELFGPKWMRDAANDSYTGKEAIPWSINLNRVIDTVREINRGLTRDERFKSVRGFTLSGRDMRVIDELRHDRNQVSHPDREYFYAESRSLYSRFHDAAKMMAPGPRPYAIIAKVRGKGSAIAVHEDASTEPLELSPRGDSDKATGPDCLGFVVTIDEAKRFVPMFLTCKRCDLPILVRVSERGMVECSRCQIPAGLPERYARLNRLAVEFKRGKAE